jgi:hypothetical protein
MIDLNNLEMLDNNLFRLFYAVDEKSLVLRKVILSDFGLVLSRRIGRED